MNRKAGAAAYARLAAPEMKNGIRMASGEILIEKRMKSYAPLQAAGHMTLHSIAERSIHEQSSET